ncbi:subtilisin-like protease [Xylaria sp. FL0064]|nr:subtilisin-like protease [Xylaria sp. FL0064]
MSQEEIVINGRALATDIQEADASSSNHIIIRTTGEPLNRARKEELKALGVEIQEFVGTGDQQVYLCRYPKNSLVKIRALDYIDYANIYSGEFVVPDVLQTTSAHANSMMEVDVLMHHDIDQVSNTLISKILEAADVSKSAVSVDDGIVRLKVDSSTLDAIAALDEVRVIHPVNERTCFNNVARRILRSDDAILNSTIYRGQDQIICVADTGFDMGSTADVLKAFDGRVKELHAWGRSKDNLTDDPDGHGTHVCGSVLGRGQHNSEGLIEGMAPAASLIVQSLFVRFNYMNQSILGFPRSLEELFDQAYQAGARIHTNSWGTPLPSTKIQRPYDTSAESIDRYVWGHQDMTILFAAGNDGQDQDLDGTVNDRSLGSEASAKNCITVGASENDRPTLLSGKTGAPYTYGTFWPTKFTKNPLKDDHQANNPEGLAAFSSRGPTAENRLKPDVVAPGTAILSTKSRKKKFLSTVDKTGVSDDGQYMYLSGTSMATPLVAGCCAALRECLLKNGYKDEEGGINNPTASLIKALIINGAVPISGQYMPDEFGQGPNSHSGFGRVNIANSFAMIEPSDALSGYGVGVVDEETEEPFVTQILVPSSDKNLTLKLTMAYADLPGAALSNDLNVVVIAGDKERHGNQGNQDFSIGATGPFDRSNNVEQVMWPQIIADRVMVIVKHYRLLSARVQFAYAWRFLEEEL